MCMYLLGSARLPTSFQQPLFRVFLKYLEVIANFLTRYNDLMFHDCFECLFLQ